MSVDATVISVKSVVFDSATQPSRELERFFDSSLVTDLNRLEIPSFWLAMVEEGPKGGEYYVRWNNQLTRTPPRRALSGDYISTELPIYWLKAKTELGQMVVRDPSGIVWYVLGDRISSSSNTVIDDIVNGKLSSVDFLKFNEGIWRTEEDGDHFGEASAVVTQSAIMMNSDLYGGNLVPGLMKGDDIDPFNDRLPDEALVTYVGAVAQPLVNRINLVMRGSYSTIDEAGTTNEFTVDTPLVLAAPRANLLTVHAVDGQSPGVELNLERFPDLKRYIDLSQPLGDTRQLTGLSTVIASAGRGMLIGSIQGWFAAGTKHGETPLGYVKLWLYVIAIMQRNECNAAVPGLNWVFANDAGAVGPHYENSSVDRRGWDAQHASINDGSRGWGP
jgi:hypothetical protein